ncbi:mechanosensitive ion channel [Aquibium sp. A9E412]|uniref:mechanosensitive ion channel family protein n=1 Tax=Aquibium sp. A9E412 TaxID=2976767 RepID=UPI0025AEFFB0|nr:mechanosensitive ion channel domain-containing protein [Aquibium sp. A9E412]MDN2567156.1 mechanosensitive ion channel [Aquibium sp. A9E412]
MEFDTAGMVDAAQAAMREASELAVAYSFSILGAIVLLIVGFVVAGILKRWTYSGLGRFESFDETLRKFFAKVVRYAVLALVIIAVLAQFGVQTASIIAALGAVGLAIGLALQGTLQNIAAGIMLLVLKPFRVGEYVDCGSVSGTIEEIGLFATEFKRIDGLYVLAPNSELWNTPVTNYSRNPLRRNDLTIGIGYGDDIELAQQTLADLAARDGRVLDDPAPATFVGELGDSAVAVTLRYWTTTPDWWQTRLDMTKAGKQAFDAKGITIPFPQRDVHVVPAALKEAAE